ncbi:LacI family DNA-binding transcriptional regulator [Halovulum sp. GXIMD14794]
MPEALPTLEDVARACNVSTATVSRALNAPTRVRPETLRKVQDAVAKLGYTPHFGGRALASNRTFTVGAVIPTMENAIFARGLQALQEHLSAAGITLLVATSDYDPDKEAAQVQALLARSVDGMVLIGEARDTSVYDLLNRRNVPFVLVWTWREDCPYPCVGFDNAAAAEEMADAVLDLGHREIAMIAGITAGNDRAASRVAGLKRAMQRRGLSLPPERLIESEYTLEAGANAARQLLSLSPRPTALFCGNDVLAAGAYSAIHEAGLSIPGDISITGFDDIDLALVLSPPLTTVHVPHRRMGDAAGELLLRLSGVEPGPAAIPLETHIAHRGSLAVPPS